MKQLGNNIFVFGDDVNTGEKYWLAGNGASNRPGMRYATANAAMQFSNDGTTWLNYIGSSGAATPGSILFAGANNLVNQDNTNLFWDNTLKRATIAGMQIGLNGISALFSGKTSFMPIGSFIASTVGAISNSIVFNTSTVAGNNVVMNNSFLFSVADTDATTRNVSNRLQFGGNLTPQGTQTVQTNAVHATIFGSHVHFGGLYKNEGFGSNNIAVTASNGAAVNGSAIGFDVGITRDLSANATTAQNVNMWGRAINTPSNLNATIPGGISNQWWLGRSITVSAANSRNNTLVFGVNGVDLCYEGNGANRLLLDGIQFGTAGVDLAGTNYMLKKNGIAPTTVPSNSHAYYSANSGGPGTASPHWRLENGDVVRLFKQSAPGSAAFVANVGMPVNDNSTFGGYTIGQLFQAIINLNLM